MKKDLPKMYYCSINKEINNIQDIYSSINKDINNEARNINYNQFDVENKINDIFKSPSFVYKADVNIVFNDKTIKKRIIAKRKNNLITIDNERIPINLIKDIYI